MFKIKILSQEPTHMNSQLDRHLSAIVTGNIIQVILAEQNRDSVHSVNLFKFGHPSSQFPSLFFSHESSKMSL